VYFAIASALGRRDYYADRVDDVLRQRLHQAERLLRPRSVAALRQAGQVARAIDALEQATVALQTASADIAEHTRLVRQLLDLHTPSPANHEYDDQTVQLMRDVLRPSDTCIDVGANEGLILEHIVALAPSGHHFAFEPIPGLAARLRERFPKVEVHEVALAAEEGSSTFHYVVSNPSYSGIRERRYDRPEETVELITVRTARLDDVLSTDTDVRFVKIDVEGGEEGVLRGGLKTLERCRPYVVFEHGLGAADYYGTEPETVYDLLRGVDLRVTLLDRYLSRAPSLSRQEFNEQFHQGRNYNFLAHP
jgi:FkbM family methyltransferase